MTERDRFPWRTHRTLAEVSETDALNNKVGKSALSQSERGRLGILMAKAYAANSVPNPGDAV